MALTPDTDQFSQFLRLAFLRSPNYVTGISGWTINQDGSAEFNNLTIRGTFKGTDFIINSSGAFFYNGAPALGNLIASIASVAGTDSFGNAYQAGITSYGASGAYSQLAAGNVQSVGPHAPFSPAFMAASAAAAGIMGINSGLATNLDTAAVLLVNSKVNNGVVQYQDAVDGITYDTGQLTLVSAGVTINTSLTQTTVFSRALSAGTYEIEIWLVSQNTTPADGAQWAFTGSGGLVVGAPTLVEFESTTTGTAVDGYAASSTYTTTFNGQGVGGNQRLLVRATLTITTAGTLTFGGKELVAGNTVTVSAGSRMRIRRIVAT